MSMLGTVKSTLRTSWARFWPFPSRPEEAQADGGFSEEAFRGREVYRPNYRELCAAVADLIEFRSILDLGCANGFVLEEMKALGKTVRGVEISSAALAFLRPDLRESVLIASATSLGKIGQFDL